jgi:hypothetical protein
MKKIISLLLITATIFALASCGGDKTVPDGMQLVNNDKQTYTLFVPETWTVDVTDGISSAYANDRSNISLMTMQWSSSQYSSLEEYCAQYYKDIAATFKNVSAIEEYKENQYFGTLPALKFVYTIGPDAVEGQQASSASNMKYKFMQIFTFGEDGQVYIFTYTALEKNYESHLKSVNIIIETFIP